jgi:hypothetical protein
MTTMQAQLGRATPDTRPRALSRLVRAFHRLADRGQLGPTRELEWRAFQPRH